jgi:hypothetical protein
MTTKTLAVAEHHQAVLRRWIDPCNRAPQGQLGGRAVSRINESHRFRASGRVQR